MPNETHKTAAAPGPTTSAPTVKVEVTAAPAPRTPAQDALDALPARKAAEAAAVAEQAKLADEGKLVAPGPITAYEHERAKLGSPADEADAK